MSQLIPTDRQNETLPMLTSDATHCALGGGSRSGKTFWLVYCTTVRAQMAPHSRHGIFRFRFNALQAAVIEDTFPKVMRLAYPGYMETVGARAWSRQPGKYFFRFHNGSEIWFGGLGDKDQVEQVLGMEFVTLYFNECSQIPWHSVVTARTRLAQKVETAGDNPRELALKAYYDFNPPSKRHWTYQQFIEKRDPDNRNKAVKNEFDYGYMLMNPGDNRANLSPKYLAQLDALPPKARRRFLLGQFADDSDGSLWTDELLDQQRFLPSHDNPLPKMVRIVVAVDPSGCSGDEDTRSDEVGIVVVGLGTDGNGYVIEDLSGRYGPAEWSLIVNTAYERHLADAVVAERNFGGAMVEEVLRAQNDSLPVKLVTASRGKAQRAEPISTLYEKAKVFHAGYFPELEDQLCSFTVVGYQGMKSPDRADAAIWGLTELFPGMTRKAEENAVWTPPSVITRPRSMSRYTR